MTGDVQKTKNVKKKKNTPTTIPLQILFAAFLATDTGKSDSAAAIGNDIAPQSINETMSAVVADIISRLEAVSPSLGKGVMVVASNGRDVPDGFPETVQTRCRQPVYMTATSYLSAAAPPGTTTERRDENGDALAPLCVPPASRQRHVLLPPPSRYVVLFRGLGDQFVRLVELNYTFWDVNVYYVIVSHDFDSTVQRFVRDLWRKFFMYK